MAGIPTEHLADQVEATSRRLEESMRGVASRLEGLATEFAAFRGEVRTDLRWIKRIGAAPLLAAFGFAGYLIADLATLKAEARQHDVRLEKVEGRLGGMETDLATLKAEARQHDVRLEKVEGRLDGTEKRLEGLDRKLDMVLSRLPAGPPK